MAEPEIAIEDLPLDPERLQGEAARYSGTLQVALFKIGRNPSKVRLVIGKKTLCFLQISPEQVELFKNRMTAVEGTSYFLKGIEAPLVLPSAISNQSRP